MMRAGTFEQRFQPQPAPSGSDFWERDEVANTNPSHVWTVIEVGGKTYAVAGYHLVNRIAYVVTTKPWITGDEEARW